MHTLITNHPICNDNPEWRAESAWTGHIPFGMWIISALKPKLFVELGVHKGTSYCAFCQAITKLNLNTKAYGVDTWKGDPRNGYADPEFWGYNNNLILNSLRAHHDPKYGHFSTLLPMKFEEAINVIPEQIDLLHIDGGHSYESVNLDFQTWLPKMSNNGIILFHDTCIVDDPAYGVHKLWDELTAHFPGFNFPHSCGLGVLAVGKELPADIKDLINCKGYDINRVRSLFIALAQRFA